RVQERPYDLRDPRDHRGRPHPVRRAAVPPEMVVSTNLCDAHILFGNGGGTALAASSCSICSFESTTFAEARLSTSCECVRAPRIGKTWRPRLFTHASATCEAETPTSLATAITTGTIASARGPR